ncbi:MAG: restriction endonuclease [bacterium]
MDHWLEAARYASRQERIGEARKWFEHVGNNASSPERDTALLLLSELLIDSEEPESARKTLESVDEHELTSYQKRLHLFVKARINEELGNSELAHELYLSLYDRDSSFRNVEQKVQEHQATISSDNILHEFRILDRANFAECCRNIVRMMDYEPIETDSLNDEEVNITARDDSSNFLKADKHLFAFKQWDSYVGILALKEFEMQILEGRYDRGVFVVSRGYKPSAIDYAEKSPKMELIGPEELIEPLRKIL